MTDQFGIENKYGVLSRFRAPMLASVASRLRVVLLSIALLVGCASVIGAYQLFSLQRSQEILVSHSVPELIQSQKLASLLATHSVLTNKLKIAGLKDEIQALAERLTANMNSLASTLSAAKVDRRSNPTPSILKANLKLLRESKNRVIPLRQKLVTLTNQIAAHRAQLFRLNIKIRDLSEPVSIDTATAIEAALAKLSATPSINQDRLPEEIRNLVETQDRITEIDFGLTRTIELAEQLSIQEKPVLFDSIVARIRFQINSTTQLLVRLPLPAAKRGLAVLIKELRELLFSPAGFVESLRKIQLSNNQFSREQILQQTITTEFSNRIYEIVSDAEHEIDLNAQKFQKTFDRTLLVLSLSTLLVVLIVGVVLHFIVGRQIAQRMVKLTQIVLDIAGGDHNRKVDVSGHDELASMANALTVFKNNARELERSNEELEKFAYAASHDLRSPLRAIENLAEWTLEDDFDQLPQGSIENLRKILERTKRLSMLQTGLLEYSQVGKLEMDAGQANIREMIDGLADLLDPEKKHLITINCDSEHVSTFLTPLQQILMNLIGNSIKHHDQASGRLTISVNRRDARVRVRLTDDGPGIEPRFHERIFGLFQTLKSRDEVEGSGLGLSLIKKQVEHYGGVITVNSDPSVNRGTTFEFDLPDTAANAVLNKTANKKRLPAIA